MSEWQPIETAPRDGTPVLGAWWDGPCDNWNFCVVQWTGSAPRGHWVHYAGYSSPPHMWQPITLPAPPAKETQE